MRRKIYDRLLQWKREKDGTTALMIEGARRVGKSYIAEEFAKNHKGVKKNETDVLLVIKGKSGRSVEDFSQFGSRYNRTNQREVLFDKGMNVRFERLSQENETIVFYISEL